MDVVPQDLWTLIASFRSKTQRQMRLANTKWFNTIKYNNFGLHFTHKEDIPAITERFSKYSWPITLNFIKPKLGSALDLIDHLTKLTNLAKIQSDGGDMKTYVTLEQWMKLSVLTNLEVWIPFEEHIPDETLAHILKQMVNLKSLRHFENTRTWPFAANRCLQ
jgi:hypothetical protein